jgi:hypothetical protein
MSAATLRLGEGEEYVLTASTARTYDAEHDAAIIAWRVECFERLGLEPLHVGALAVRRDIDRTDVEQLVDAGATSAQVGALLL